MWIGENAALLASGWKQKDTHLAVCLISRIGNAVAPRLASAPAFIRIRASQAKGFS